MKKLMIAAFVALALPAFAQDGRFDNPRGEDEIPEGRVLPNEVETITGKKITTGWTIHYLNAMRWGGSVTDRMDVTLPNGEPGEITWLIEYTPNAPCVRNDDPEPPEVCADTITITKVPPGYIAIPYTATVNEGYTLEILVIPELMG